MFHRVMTVLVLALALGAGGLAREEALTEVPGACADVFGGEVCTWATLDDATLVEAGATIPLASIEGAPTDVPMVWPPVPEVSVDMPQAVTDQAGLRQLTVNWEAGGHPPGAFMTPHFDFHFYMASPADIAAVDCVDERKPAELPADYELPDIPLPPEMAEMLGVPVLVGLCVPQMGMHALLASETQRTAVFDGTMVIGYYRGTPTFIEPMISKAMLMKRASFDLDVPIVPGLTGSQPTRFRAEYDRVTDTYRFTLSGFVPAT